MWIASVVRDLFASFGLFACLGLVGLIQFAGWSSPDGQLFGSF